MIASSCILNVAVAAAAAEFAARLADEQKERGNQARVSKTR